MEVPQCSNTDVMREEMPFGILTIAEWLAQLIASLFESAIYKCEIMKSTPEQLIIAFYDKGFELIITSAPNYSFSIKVVYVPCNRDEDEVLLALQIRKMFVGCGYKELNTNNSIYSLEKLICCLNVKDLLNKVSLAGKLIHLTPDDFLRVRKCGLPPNPDTLN